MKLCLILALLLALTPAAHADNITFTGEIAVTITLITEGWLSSPWSIGEEWRLAYFYESLQVDGTFSHFRGEVWLEPVTSNIHLVESNSTFSWIIEMDVTGGSIARMGIVDPAGILFMDKEDMSFDGNVLGKVTSTNPAPVSVPEPTPAVLMAVGLGMVGLLARKRAPR